MRGYPSIRKEATLIYSLIGSDGLRGLIVVVSAGVIAGCLSASLRLHLGLPGHKALIWMTPVIIARLLGRCRIGATAGSFTAAFVSLGLGGNLAGGLIGLPLVALAGACIDVSITRLERHETSAVVSIISISSTAMFANLICFAKRLLLPAGLSPHDVFTSAGLIVRPVSYALFGFISGLIAAITAYFITRRKKLR
jgi:hypothetical protein